jgi:hypothetical protein
MKTKLNTMATFTLTLLLIPSCSLSTTPSKPKFSGTWQGRLSITVESPKVILKIQGAGD